MISYQVQKGDTIAQVTKRFNTDWQTLKRQNPEAVGRSKMNGNWFLREKATLKINNSFAESLQLASREQNTVSTSPPAAPKPLTQLAQPFLYDFDHKTGENKPDLSEDVIEHTLKPGETVWELAVKKYHVNVADILKENNIKDPTTLQIGQKLRIPLPEKGGVEDVVASWYGEDFHGKPMANGQIFDMYGATIAHKELPLGTQVELTNTETGQTVQATVSDRGPYIEGRDVDLSYGLAKLLSLLEDGVGSLEMRIL